MTRSPIIELEMCTIGTERRCFSVKLTTKVFWYGVLLFAISIAASGIYGFSVAPWTPLGWKYAAYQLSLNALILAMTVPVVGLIIGIGFFGLWTGLSQVNLGLTLDFWLSSITIAAFWIGMVLQVFILVYIFWTLITKSVNYPRLKSGAFDRG